MKNKSIILTGVFCLIAVIFGKIFWSFLGSDDAFEKMRWSDRVGLSGKQSAAVLSAASPSDSAASTLPKAPVEDSASAPSATENSLSASKEESPKKDETENWKIYKDEKNSFEFKYPQDAEVTPNEDFIKISEGNDKLWKLRSYENKNKVDLQAWYEEYFSEKERKNCTFSSSESGVKIGSYETKYVSLGSESSQCKKAGYFSASTDKKKIIRVEIGNETVENVNKILATFRFE